MSNINRNERAEFLAQLQMKWLKEMERRIDAGEATAGDMATLARVLLASGLMFGEHDLEIPDDLKTKLNKDLSDLDFESDDLDFLKGM